MNTPIYARDLTKEIKNDTFMGVGFEKAMAKAEKNNEELVVGFFTDGWEVSQ